MFPFFSSKYFVDDWYFWMTMKQIWRSFGWNERKHSIKLFRKRKHEKGTDYHHKHIRHNYYSGVIHTHGVIEAWRLSIWWPIPCISHQLHMIPMLVDHDSLFLVVVYRYLVFGFHDLETRAQTSKIYDHANTWNDAYFAAFLPHGTFIWHTIVVYLTFSTKKYSILQHSMVLVVVDVHFWWTTCEIHIKNTFRWTREGISVHYPTEKSISYSYQSWRTRRLVSSHASDAQNPKSTPTNFWAVQCRVVFSFFAVSYIVLHSGQEYITLRTNGTVSEKKGANICQFVRISISKKIADLM